MIYADCVIDTTCNILDLCHRWIVCLCLQIDLIHVASGFRMELIVSYMIYAKIDNNVVGSRGWTWLAMPSAFFLYQTGQLLGLQPRINPIMKVVWTCSFNRCMVGKYFWQLKLVEVKTTKDGIDSVDKVSKVLFSLCGGCTLLRWWFSLFLTISLRCKLRMTMKGRSRPSSFKRVGSV